MHRICTLEHAGLVWRDLYDKRQGTHFGRVNPEPRPARLSPRGPPGCPPPQTALAVILVEVALYMQVVAVPRSVRRNVTNMHAKDKLSSACSVLISISACQQGVHTILVGVQSTIQADPSIDLQLSPYGQSPPQLKTALQ